MLNVWASWCPNCRAEHPLLGELASAVPLYGPQLPGQGDAARAWLTGGGQPYRAVLADPDGRLALELGVYGTPETYLFAGDGTLLTRHTGLAHPGDLATPVCPLLAKARSNTASQPEVEREVRGRQCRRASHEPSRPRP